MKEGAISLGMQWLHTSGVHVVSDTIHVFTQVLPLLLFLEIWSLRMPCPRIFEARKSEVGCGGFRGGGKWLRIINIWALVFAVLNRRTMESCVKLDYLIADESRSIDVW